MLDFLATIMAIYATLLATHANFFLLLFQYLCCNNTMVGFEPGSAGLSPHIFGVPALPLSHTGTPFLNFKMFFTHAN